MTVYRIDACTATRIRGRVYRSEETVLDGIATRRQADQARAIIAAERPDALVVITAYAVR